jgi:hypothetical protein
MPQAYGRCARLSCSVPPIALSWGATALWLVSVPRIREDCTMSRQLLGYLVTRTLLTVSLPPLAQLPAQMPRRGFLRRGASSRNLSLLDAYWAERRALGWVEGQHIAMASRSGVRRMRGPQAASPLALGLDRHLAGTPAVHTRLCGSCAPWRKRQRRTYGGDGAARVARTQHRGRRDAASWLATLERHRAGPPAIFVPPAVSPGGPPSTTDTRPGMDAGTVVTSRARGGLGRPLGMAVKTCRALDPYA